MQSTLIKDFQSDKQLMRTLLNNFGQIIIFIFYAQWNQNSLQFMNKFNDSIAIFGNYNNVKYFSISAQKCTETFKKFTVELTPTVIITQTDKKILYKNMNEDIGSIFEKLENINEHYKQKFQRDKKIWFNKIDSILNNCSIVIFIKGTPLNPKCGFTSTLLNLLKDNSVEYTYYDIIEDEYMRYWLREYKGWPTYPQLYVMGKLIGGLDKIKQAFTNGELLKIIPSSSRVCSVEEKFQKLMKENEIIAFIPNFGFQNQQTHNFLENCSKKYGQKLMVCNAGIDENLKDYLQKKMVLKLPMIFENGKMII